MILPMLAVLQNIQVDWALGSMLYEINALPSSYIGDAAAHDATVCSETAQASFFFFSFLQYIGVS